MEGEAQAMAVPPEEQLDGLMTSFLSDRNELYIAQYEFTKSVRNGEDSAVVEEKANRLHECKREERRSLYLLRDRLSKVVDKLKIDGPVDLEGMATERETLTADLDEKRNQLRPALMAAREQEQVVERRRIRFQGAARRLAEARVAARTETSAVMKALEQAEHRHIACSRDLADAEIMSYDLTQVYEQAQHAYARAYYALASLGDRHSRRRAMRPAQQKGHSATRSQDEAAS